MSNQIHSRFTCNNVNKEVGGALLLHSQDSRVMNETELESSAKPFHSSYVQLSVLIFEEQALKALIIGNIGICFHSTGSSHDHNRNVYP